MNTALSALTWPCSATQDTTRMWLLKVNVKSAQQDLTALTAHLKTALPAITALEILINDIL